MGVGDDGFAGPLLEHKRKERYIANILVRRLVFREWRNRGRKVLANTCWGLNLFILWGVNIHKLDKHYCIPILALTLSI